MTPERESYLARAAAIGVSEEEALAALGVAYREALERGQRLDPYGDAWRRLVSSPRWCPKVTGRLFVAELNTEPPDMTAKDGTFAVGWRKPWLPAGVVYAKPIEMRPADLVDHVTEFGVLDRTFGPAGYLLKVPTADVGEWPSRYRPTTLYSPPSIYEVKFMVGWESADRAERIVCRQVLSVAWPRVFRVESHPEGSWTMWRAAMGRAGAAA